MNPLQNMLLGIAIGDAFGAGYEFAFDDRSKFQEVNLDSYRSHPNPNHIHTPGMYTDDTQMSIAVAELLASELEFNHKNLADAFVTAYKRDPIFGYARGFKAFLDSISSGKEFLAKIRPDSEKSGAAMRAVPIGIVPDLETVIQYARINANLTHNTPKGIDSSVAVALLAHHNFYHRRIPDAKDVIPHMQDAETAEYLKAVYAMKSLDARQLLGEKNVKRGVPSDGMRVTGAVLYLLSNFTEPTDVLREAIRLGGDVDTVASISLGINLMHNDLNKLPKHLYDGLANHKFGRDYLISLGTSLAGTTWLA